MEPCWTRIVHKGRHAIGVVISLSLLATAVHAQQPLLDPAAIRIAVERGLTAAPRGFERLQPPEQTGVRLLGVEVQRLSASGQRVILNLSQKALTYDPDGDIEPLIDHLIASAARLTAGLDVDYQFLVDGLALDRFLTRVAPDARGGTRQVGAAGRAVISAGHGWYFDEASSSWRLQRDYYWGIVEDLVNHDIVNYLDEELKRAGLDARPARNPDRSSGPGVSGRPRWEESAKYYIHDLGAPAAVWDYGADDYSKDINSRPFYANWIDSAVMISVHNNGGGGSGTETWYDTTNGYDAESQRLAQIINRRVVSAIRTRFNPDWPDRGLRSCNGCKGENRLAGRPAIILEIAFMDTRTPDNDALHSEAFKQVVAQAIREGLQEWGLSRAEPDVDNQARAEMAAQAMRDSRFIGLVEGSGGADLTWDQAWELRWVDANFTAGRVVRIWHTTSRLDRAVRYTAYWDPDTGAWRGWERVR